jgi:hypothetical protein
MNKILRSVTLLSLFTSAAAACGGQAENAPGPGSPVKPAPPQYAQQPGYAPQPQYAPQGQQAQQVIPPPSAFNHTGFVYYGGPQPQAAAPVPITMPPVHSRVEALNVNYLRQAAAQPRKCNLPHEVADGVFVHVDCYPYRRIPIAVKHATPAKLAMIQRGHVRWNPSARFNVIPLQRPGVNGGTTVRGGAPSGAMTVGAAPGDPGGGATRATDAPQAFPDAVDHRLNGTEGPIKDQGDVGNCTAFALSAVMDNSLRRAGQNLTTSPEHIWAHYGIPTMEDAATANVNKGITTFEAWPYSGREACEISRDSQDDCGAAYNVAPNSASRDAALQQHYQAAEAANGHRVVSYEELSVAPVNVDEIVSTLASGADLWVAFHIDSSTWVNRKMQNFVIPDWSTPDGGHAVALSGYRNTPQGRQFLIHNSWGPKWGDSGYAWVSQNMVQKWLHLAYKVRTDLDSTAPAPQVNPIPGVPVAPAPAAPKKPKTDEDCPGDQVMDSVSGTCAVICTDQSRPANGQCPNGPAPAPTPGALALPGFPNGFPQIPGFPAWPPAPQPNAPQPSAPAPGTPSAPAPNTPAPSAQPAAPAAPFPMPSGWSAPWPMPSGLPQFWPPPPAPQQ